MQLNIDELRAQLHDLRAELHVLTAALEAHISEVMMLYTVYNRITEAELLQVIKTTIPIQKALMDVYWWGSSFDYNLHCQHETAAQG